jgi:hypothetical protein
LFEIVSKKKKSIRMTFFFERKMQTLFQRLDIDSSGELGEDDFDEWANNLIALGKFY